MRMIPARCSTVHVAALAVALLPPLFAFVQAPQPAQVASRLPEPGSKISLNEKPAQNAVSPFARSQTVWKRCEGHTLVR